MTDFIKELESNQEPAEVKKVKAFLSWSSEERSFDEEIVIAVIKQMGVDSFLSHAENAANHGMSGGYDGFTYYTDTEAFYKENRELIIAWAKEYNSSLGLHDSFLGMIASCKGMRDAELGIDTIAELIYSNNDDHEDYTAFSNIMAWIIAEEICHAYSDFSSEYEEEFE